MAIYPKPNHTLYVVLIGKTKWTYAYTFALSLFLFFFFLLFQVEALDLIFWPPSSP
jgi:hypothetical protein